MTELKNPDRPTDNTSVAEIPTDRVTLIGYISLSADVCGTCAGVMGLIATPHTTRHKRTRHSTPRAKGEKRKNEK